MARYTGPKNRIARREGVDLGYKTPGSHAHSSLLRRINVPPGQHGPKGKKKISGYGTQLREKQKMRHQYGVMEKQLRTYVKHAMKQKGNTGESLLQQLECRLDNIVYRLSFAPTRFSARQLVSHGHILVDNKRVTIPSYQVSANQVISIKPKALNIPVVKKQLEDKNPKMPEWIERKAAVGMMKSIPVRAEIDTNIDEQLIVEYYSR